MGQQGAANGNRRQQLGSPAPSDAKVWPLSPHRGRDARWNAARAAALSVPGAERLMSDSDLPVRLVFVLAAACSSLAGCTGPALLKEPRPIESSKAVVEGWDERILASVGAVILRNGPGAWARDAEWDEYLFRIRALSDEDVEIRGI